MRDGERPPLTVVRRDGDPRPALAVAIAHDAGPIYNQRLARALADSFTRAKLEPRTTLFTRGFVLSSSVTAKELPATFDLRKMVLAAGETAAAAVSSPPRSAADVSPSSAFDPCDPLPVFAEKAPELGRQNVAIGLVGSEEQTNALADRLTSGDEWPLGDLPIASTPEKDLFLSQRSTASEVSLAVLTKASSRLLETRSALLKNALLADVVRSFPPHFRSRELSVGLGPQGGCLALGFDTSGTLTRDDAARFIVAARELVESELARAAESSRLLPAVLSSNARDSAEHAAWQGLGGHDPTDETAATVIAVVRSPEAKTPGPLLDGELGKAIASARSEKGLEVRTRVEAGQGRVWASLRSACPTAHETRDSAGFTSVALENAARSAPSPDLLESYSGYGGPALVAHVPLVGDDPPELVADALAAGLLSSLESGSEVNSIARARRDALASTKLVEFATELLTHGHPSRVLNAGTHDSLSRINPGAVRTALTNFLNTPLSLDVIANRDDAQGRRIGARLSRLLSPFLGQRARCPEWDQAPVPGSYALATDSAGASLVLAYPIPLPQLPAARAVASLLGQKDGFLDQALVSPGLAARASAAATGTSGGSAALFIALEASPEAIEPAATQLRALMQRVSGGAILEQHQRALATRWRPQPRTTPLSRLFHDPIFDAAPSLDVLRRFAHSYLTEEKLVMVQARRTQ